MTDQSLSASNRLSDRAASHADAFAALQAAESTEVLETVAALIARSLNAGGKVIFFGNGGSAADAAHLSAEFVGRFRADRRPLASIALGTNPAVTTALGNDYGFIESVFARELEALAQQGDVAVALTTSGRSPNILASLARARELGITTVALCGAAHQLAGLVDQLIVIDSTQTALIQEMQAVVGHILCEMVEDQMGFRQ